MENIAHCFVVIMHSIIEWLPFGTTYIYHVKSKRMRYLLFDTIGWASVNDVVLLFEFIVVRKKKGRFYK
jgi:hypothetical protein